MLFRVFFCIFFIFLIANAQASEQNFNKAKEHLRQYYKDNPTLRTFYCGCQIQWVGKLGVPQYELCRYEPRNKNSRAERIEWEHVMPASWFGRQLQCWQEGGRKGCRQNKEFREMEGDMHNIFPAIGELNNDRSDYRFAAVLLSDAFYGGCDFKVDFKGRKVEPRDAIKGDVARAMLYMNERYSLDLSSSQVQLYEAWAKLDPVSEEERKRNDFIKSVQGNGNRFIEGSYFDSIKSFFKSK